MAFKWFRVYLGSETQLLLAHQLRQKGGWASKELVIEFAGVKRVAGVKLTCGGGAQAAFGRKIYHNISGVKMDRSLLCPRTA
ncbi:hypothetical protein I79_023427 [Cricetulus griseus]|uniref:Uncharacterized protein n=1 Tax=Cricetulus griseus TaxID=10029 RepID=G3IHX1_CRIGR|nr:hypothetical protein I79_023427 [Cricetulus griseus]